MNKLSIIIGLIMAFGFSVTAQTGQTNVPKTIAGGVINGKAVNLVKPAYPPAARAVNASGTVNVQVTIDEEGSVIAATAVSGHPLLRAAAEQAARASQFSPTRLSGQPVKVSGIIVYNFVANSQTNEEKVKILGLAAFLSILRNTTFDLERLNDAFDSKDFIKDSLEDFPTFAVELAPLKTLASAPNENRLEIIDAVAEAVKVKLKSNELWQFELGKNFGDFFSQFMPMANENQVDFSKLNDSGVRLTMAKIKDLTYSAPDDFPPAVLEKFKEFSAFGETKQLKTADDLKTLYSRLAAIFEAISPGSTK